MKHSKGVMGLRRKYWMAFYDLKLASFYYQLYGISSSRWGKAISVLCALTSAGFVASSFFSKTYPSVWAFITLACQLVLAYQPFSAFGKRKVAAEYIYEDLQALALEAEETWGRIQSSSDGEEINRLAYELRKKQDEIEGRFATVETFPMNDLIYKRAKKKTDKYFRRFAV